MRIETDRFGTIELTGEEVLDFPAGVIGFPEAKRFALIRHGSSQCVGWLQSLENGALAFPVVSAHGLTDDYPDVEVNASEAGLGEEAEDLAIMAVLCAPRGGPATVNLMAPILVNASTRKGAQVHLEGTRFSTRELFVLPKIDATDDKAVQDAASAP